MNKPPFQLINLCVFIDIGVYLKNGGKNPRFFNRGLPNVTMFFNKGSRARVISFQLCLLNRFNAIK